MALFSMSVDAIALVAATAKSIAELGAGSQTRIKIIEWSVTFDGVTATAVPVKVEVGRFSSGVTTATTFTAGKNDPDDGTPDTTAKHSTSSEGAGTVDASARIYRIPPTSGLLYQAPLGRELLVPKSGFWRIRCTAAAGVNVSFDVTWEE